MAARMEVSLEMASIIWTFLAWEVKVGLSVDALESIQIDFSVLVGRFEFFSREFDFCS